jgi:hypothetical protein
VLGPEHPDTFPSVGNLGSLYQAQGRYSEAELLLKRALAAREKTLGPEHPDTLRSVNNLGFLYFDDEAEMKRRYPGLFARYWERSAMVGLARIAVSPC